ncbi:MAG: ybgR [Bacteroidetes bacterium]|nr:ybgR [Bacteroidota bacterium]
MAHDHAHDHDHHDHHHAITLTHVSKAFVIGIAFNFLFVVIEVVVGFYIHSLSLLSDAGHNLADVASLALTLLAFRLAEVKPSDTYTYGYRKTSILVALFNAMVLVASVGAIAYEAAHRFLHPEPLPGGVIAIVAGIGIFINGGTALLFIKQKDKDLNIKAAYLHLASDALVSLALVIGGIIIYFTQLYIIDAVLSIAVAVVILVSTWKLLKNSLRLSLDGVPDTIDMDEVKAVIKKEAGVKDIHHVHIWAIGTTVNALTAHIVLDNTITVEAESALKHRIRHQLQHLNIHHATLETERQGQACDATMCQEKDGV